MQSVWAAHMPYSSACSLLGAYKPSPERTHSRGSLHERTKSASAPATWDNFAKHTPLCKHSLGSEPVPHPSPVDLIHFRDSRSSRAARHIPHPQWGLGRRPPIRVLPLPPTQPNPTRQFVWGMWSVTHANSTTHMWLYSSHMLMVGLQPS